MKVVVAAEVDRFLFGQASSTEKTSQVQVINEMIHSGILVGIGCNQRQSTRNRLQRSTFSPYSGQDVWPAGDRASTADSVAAFDITATSSPRPTMTEFDPSSQLVSA